MPSPLGKVPPKKAEEVGVLQNATNFNMVLHLS